LTNFAAQDGNLSSLKDDRIGAPVCPKIIIDPETGFAAICYSDSD
jgi:hypothetical protein